MLSVIVSVEAHSGKRESPDAWIFEDEASRTCFLGGALRIIHEGAIGFCLWYANVHYATYLPLYSGVEAGVLYTVSLLLLVHTIYVSS